MRECENCNEPIVKTVMRSGAEVWVHVDRNGVPADRYCKRTVAKPVPLSRVGTVVQQAALDLFLERGEMADE